MKTTVDIAFLLMKAGDELSQMLAYTDTQYYGASSISLSAAITAKCLIEIVELVDCGSTGGFGIGQPHCGSLYERWIWLCEKYWPEYINARNQGNSGPYFDFKFLRKNLKG